MTPHTELDRLFAQELRAIPKPDPLSAAWTAAAKCIRENKLKIDPVDADEAVHGVCAQGDCDEQ